MLDYVRVHLHGVPRLMRMRAGGGVRHIIIDADGCLTDGQIYLQASDRRSDGVKLMKVFGPDDDDAIKDARAHGIDVRIVTADKRGLPIVQARGVTHRVPVVSCSPTERCQLDIDYTRAVYIGDGWHDHRVMRYYGFGIAPHDAFPRTKRTADAVTSRDGGRRAVAQAIDFVLRRMG